MKLPYSNLKNMRQFYLMFPIRHALRSELGSNNWNNSKD
jgi:hypothetical protein